MTPQETIIQHSDGRLYLVEYLGDGIVIAIYRETGERLDCANHPEIKRTLIHHLEMTGKEAV